MTRAALSVASKDLRLEWRTFETLSSSLVFSVIVLVIFSFAFDLPSARELALDRLVPGILWTVLAFATVIGLTGSFQLERRRDTLAALFLAPVDRGSIYLGKLLANLTKVAVLEIVLIPLSAVLFDLDLLAVAGPLIGVLALHTVGLVALGTLFAAIATRIGRGEALVATLLFPAATPLLISATRCSAAAIGGRPLSGVSNWLLLTAGFDLLYVFAAFLLFEFVLEE